MTAGSTKSQTKWSCGLKLDRVRAAVSGLLCGLLLPAAAPTTAVWAVGIVVGCGTNRLKPRAPRSPVEEAQILLEDGKFLDARALLEPYVAAHPDDYKATGLLAATYGGESGVSLYALATASVSGGGASQQEIMEKLVPEPTDTNIDNLKMARNLMATIPEAARTADLGLGATLYTTVYTLLMIKQLAASDAPPTVEQALEVLKSLDDASTLASANGIPAAQISQVRQQIAAEPGGNDAEKLDAFLEKVKARNGGVLPSAPSSQPR